MQNWSLKQLQELLTDKSYRRTLVRALAVIVVFCTTYALILPAITLEKDKAQEMGGVDVEQAIELQTEEEETAAAASDEPDADAKAGPDADAKAGEPQEAAAADDDNAVVPSEGDLDPAAQDTEAAAFAPGEPITYEDDTIRVTATPLDEEIPAGAELVVTPITPDMDAYDAYFEALNRGFDAGTYNPGNSLLYDVSVMVGDQEYEPKDGKIEVKLEFKDNQLTEMLGGDLDENAPLRVIHLPVKGKNSSSLENVKASRVEREYVAGTILDTDDAESVSFELDSLSVVTVTGATTDVNVTGALQGTTMKSLDYNVYAYLVQENGGDAYGVKINFTNKQFTGTISNVPVGTYNLVLAYKANNQQLTEGKWNKNNVYENIVVENTGQYIFGYSAQMPEDKTITSSDKTVSFALSVSETTSAGNVSLSTIMDRALNYGIVAEDIKYNVRSYTNFAAKHIDISNSNDSTIYSHRADGIEVVPNILASITHNGQPMSTQDKPANYYVTEDDKSKVSSNNTEETILRNKNEIEDRIEIMISNTLKQAEELAQPEKNMLTLPSVLTVDVSPYGKDETIILDATNISGEQNGFTIVKRPGQTVVFNIYGENAAPPQNIKIKLVDDEGKQIGDIYEAGDSMKNAPASDGNVWNKVIWNFPDAPSVTATNCIGGIFLVPKGDFNAANKGGGWIVARGRVSVTNEWYGFPGDDEPFKQKIIRKTFVGISEENVDKNNYQIKVWTHTNESTSGTTRDQLITSLVIKEDSDPTLIHDNTGENDQTGYLGKGVDENGDFYVEWRTPPLSVGNEHKLTEVNAASTDGIDPVLIEFTGPYSVWSDTAKDYVWESRQEDFTSADSFAGIFNVSSHNEDYRQNVYVVNHYTDINNPTVYVAPEATKQLTGRSLYANQFSFELSATGDTPHINDSNKDIVTNDANGHIKFDPIKFENLGISSGQSRKFTYAIKEVIPETATEEEGIVSNDDGYTYDTHVCNVEITVTMSPSGKYIADVKYTTDDGEDVANLFSNSYEATSESIDITARKILEGGELENGEFTFKIYNVNENGSAGDLISSANNDAHGNVVFRKAAEFAPAEFGDSTSWPKTITKKYMIEEEPGSEVGMVYATNKVYVTVSATIGEDGAITIADPVYSDTPADEGQLTAVYEPNDETNPLVGKIRVGVENVTLGEDNTVTLTDENGSVTTAVPTGNYAEFNVDYSNSYGAHRYTVTAGNHTGSLVVTATEGETTSGGGGAGDGTGNITFFNKDNQVIDSVNAGDEIILTFEKKNYRLANGNPESRFVLKLRLSDTNNSDIKTIEVTPEVIRTNLYTKPSDSDYCDLTLTYHYVVPEEVYDQYYWPNGANRKVGKIKIDGDITDSPSFEGYTQGGSSTKEPDTVEASPFTDTFNAESIDPTFINQRTTAGLEIYKTVSGLNTDKTRSYNFTITLPEGQTDAFYKMYDSNGVMKSSGTWESGPRQFTLSDGEHIALEALPTGKNITITESTDDAYTTTINRDGTDGATAEVSINNNERKATVSLTRGTARIRYVNTRNRQNVKLLKISSTDTSKVLAGAEFTVEKDDEIFVNSVISGEDGLINLGSLEVGDYYLTEIHAPDGYIPIEGRIHVRVSAYGVSASLEGSVTIYNVQVGDDGVMTVIVPNSNGYELPSTGGPGTTWIYLLGSMLILGCGILLIARRRLQ
ncbi:MAG: LPXTG cell wall anchor domain-containing protein [Firmicutes bacterium]|nr:LPXTG cell wall anchor domain-containing protein [Bacillota bacterium]